MRGKVPRADIDPAGRQRPTLRPLPRLAVREHRTVSYGQSKQATPWLGFSERRVRRRIELLLRERGEQQAQPLELLRIQDAARSLNVNPIAVFFMLAWALKLSS
jgi:hypothetical protein